MSTRKILRHRKRGGSTCMRNGRMSGGNLGQGFRLGAEMLTRGYAVNEAYNTCGAMSRAGQLSTDVTSAMSKGIPGLAGGSRKANRKANRKSRRASRKGRKANRKSRRAQRKMRGGRYEAVFEGAEYEALGPRGGMLASAGTLPCERGAGAYISPTQSTLPARQEGGAAQLAPAPFLQEQTAGYTMNPSRWLDSVGAPLELRTPVGGQMPVPACKTTGGGRRKNIRGGDSNKEEYYKNTNYVKVAPGVAPGVAPEVAPEVAPAGVAPEVAPAGIAPANAGVAPAGVAPANAGVAPANAGVAYVNAGVEPEPETEVANAGIEPGTRIESAPGSGLEELAPAPAPVSVTEGGRHRRNSKASHKARKASRKARKASRKAYRKH